MSNGMPSMTALLGMLALAGYQNRDKLAEMLGGATAPVGSASQHSSPLGGLFGNLGGMLGGAGARGLLSGGIGELIKKFQENGQVTQPVRGSLTAPIKKSHLPTSNEPLVPICSRH